MQVFGEAKIFCNSRKEQEVAPGDFSLGPNLLGGLGQKIFLQAGTLSAGRER